MVVGSLFQFYYSTTLKLGVHRKALAFLVSAACGTTQCIPPNHLKPASLLLDSGSVSWVTAPSVSEVPARERHRRGGERRAAACHEKGLSKDSSSRGQAS